MLRARFLQQISHVSHDRELYLSTPLSLRSYLKNLPQDRSVVAQNWALRPSQDLFSDVAVSQIDVFFWYVFFLA